MFIYLYISIYLSIYQKTSFSLGGRRSQRCWRGAVRNTASESKWHTQDNQGTILALESRSKSWNNLKFFPLHSDAYLHPNRELLLTETYVTGRIEARPRVSGFGCRRAGARDWYHIAERPAPAPHLAHLEGCAALLMEPVTVPRVSRSCERFPDESGCDLQGALSWHCRSVLSNHWNAEICRTILFHGMCFLIGFRKSSSPQNRQPFVRYY